MSVCPSSCLCWSVEQKEIGCAYWNTNCGVSIICQPHSFNSCAFWLLASPLSNLFIFLPTISNCVARSCNSNITFITSAEQLHFRENLVSLHDWFPKKLEVDVPVLRPVHLKRESQLSSVFCTACPSKQVYPCPQELPQLGPEDKEISSQHFLDSFGSFSNDTLIHITYHLIQLIPKSTDALHEAPTPIVEYFYINSCKVLKQKMKHLKLFRCY